MTANNRLPLLAAFALTTFLAGSAYATIAEVASFEEKVDNAAAIVLGKCLSTEAKWDSEHRFIVTYSTWQIDKVMKGSPAVSTLMLITPGGSVGGLHQETIGIPTFKTGDERVLFVRNTRSGPTVLYFDQGTYDVRSDRGDKLIVPVSTKMVKLDASTGQPTTVDEPVRSLKQFESDVRETLRDTNERHQKMDALQTKARQQASLTSVLQQNALLIGLALAGLAFATWQLLKR
jgi:hypothetical protein